MGVARNRIRLPLPPDLREARKAELRKAHDERADKVATARGVARTQIEAAKSIRKMAIAELDEKLEKKRREIDAEYDAKAAERRAKQRLEEAAT